MGLHMLTEKVVICGKRTQKFSRENWRNINILHLCVSLSVGVRAKQKERENEIFRIPMICLQNKIVYILCH